MKEEKIRAWSQSERQEGLDIRETDAHLGCVVELLSADCWPLKQLIRIKWSCFLVWLFDFTLYLLWGPQTFQQKKNTQND